MRIDWPEKVRKHLAVASVGSSTLRMQSKECCINNVRDFLVTKIPLTEIYKLDAQSYLALLDENTIELATIIKRPDDNEPNWGAARKVINIYFRLCAMNKDTYSEFKISNIEPFLEVPLDNHVVKGIDQYQGTNFRKSFKIKTLEFDVSQEIQLEANKIAKKERLYRYELDILFWRNPKNM